jgi:hypothetical protein
VRPADESAAVAERRRACFRFVGRSAADFADDLGRLDELLDAYAGVADTVAYLVRERALLK